MIFGVGGYEEIITIMMIINIIVFVLRRGFEAGWGFAVTKTYGLDKVLTSSLS